MSSPKDEWNNILRFNTHCWDDAAKWIIRKYIYLVDYLIRAKETMCFLSDPDVETLIFATLLAFRVAKGQNFDPFRTVRALPVLVCYGVGDDFESAMTTLHRVNKACLVGDDTTGTNKNLHFYHPTAEDDGETYFDTHEGQQALMRSLPKGCKLVVIPNLASWLSPGKVTSDNTASRPAFFAKLNKLGVAVALFEQASQKASIGCALVRKKTNIVRLTRDPAAPTGIGGGFSIVRTKFDTNDKIPATIQFWYTELDDELKYGWQFRDPSNAQTAKQVEIKQRQIEVARLLAMDMEQKDIATHLDVNAATISRDAAKLKADAALQQDKSALEDEWGGKPSAVVATPEGVPMLGHQPAANGRRFGRGIGQIPVCLSGDESFDDAIPDEPARRRTPPKKRVRLSEFGISNMPINLIGDDGFDPSVTGGEA